MSVPIPSEPEIPASPSRADAEPRETVFRTLVRILRTRILSGLFAALPIVLTIFIVRYLYLTMTTLLRPAITLARYVLGEHGYSEVFWSDYVAPVIAVVFVLCLLYVLGLFVQTRVVRAVDWLFLQVPIVSLIFKAINNVFESLGQQLHGQQGFKRVVLVEFPNPGMRSLAFVTNTLRDATTGRTILCVTVLTGVMPPAGFTLFVPEENVTDVDWSMNQTLTAILSGGITAPRTIRYFDGAPISSSPPGPIGVGPETPPATAGTRNGP